MAKRLRARCNGEQDAEGIIRVPVTRNHIIAVMSGKFVCRNPNCACSRARPYIEQAFHDSIVKLLFRICRKYTVGCPKDELEDLVQLCFKQLLTKLDQFDPQQSRFTTWTWTVCRNLLLHHFHSCQRQEDTFVPLDESHDIAAVSHDSTLHDDMAKVTRHLMLCNPDWKDVIGEIFGDFQTGSFNHQFCISKVARKTRRSYADVYAFVRDVVRPEFTSLFQTMEA